MKKMSMLLAAAALSLTVWTQASDPLPPLNYHKAFDFKDAIPYLYHAAALPPDEGVRQLFQSSVLLRTKVAIEIQNRCGSRGDLSGPICTAELGDNVLESAITTQIDQIVNKRLESRGSVTSTDYELAQPYPYTVITAMRFPHEARALLILELDPAADGFPVSKIRERYGEPTDQNNSGSQTALSYSSKTDHYVFVLKFLLDENDAVAKQVWLTLIRRP